MIGVKERGMDALTDGWCTALLRVVTTIDVFFSVPFAPEMS